MIDENYSSFTKTGPNKGNYKPDREPENHSKERKKSGNYLHSMATVIEKSAKKQFPAYVGKFWSMSQRLLEIYS